MHILSHNNLEEMTWEKQKMNYKMIAVDMDGTLLDSRKQISCSILPCPSNLRMPFPHRLTYRPGG